MDELIKFDPYKPIASVPVQIIVTLVIMILSNILFQLFLKLWPSTIYGDMYKDRVQEYDSLENKNISLGAFAASEILNGSLYAPIAEELFFRFFLFKSIFIAKFKMNPHLANIAQATVFGGLHLTNTIYSEQLTRMSVIQSFSSAIIGLLSGYAYMYTNSILPAMFAHILNNLNATVIEISRFGEHLDK
jgi:membrane protease YdiL (CAAX protease family)